MGCGVSQALVAVSASIAVLTVTTIIATFDDDFVKEVSSKFRVSVFAVACVVFGAAAVATGAAYDQVQTTCATQEGGE